MTMLRQQVMHADELAAAAFKEATTAEGYYAAVVARATAFQLTTHLYRIEQDGRLSGIQVLKEAAELDYKRAEAQKVLQEISHDAQKQALEVAKLSWEGRKVQAETHKIEREMYKDDPFGGIT